MSIATWEFESPPLHHFFLKFCGNSSVGRAQPCQGWGRGSESRFPLFFIKETTSFSENINNEFILKIF